MKQEEKKEEQEEVTSSKKVETVKQPSPVQETSSKKPELDPKIAKELEDLRQFKAKWEADKKEEVKVSDSFFGKKENVVLQSQKKLSKEQQEFLDMGIPLRED